MAIAVLLEKLVNCRLCCIVKSECLVLHPMVDKLMHSGHKMFKLTHVVVLESDNHLDEVLQGWQECASWALGHIFLQEPSETSHLHSLMIFRLHKTSSSCKVRLWMPTALYAETELQCIWYQDDGLKILCIYNNYELHPQSLFHASVPNLSQLRSGAAIS